MNKVILGLLLAVCVLGMALIMLNERLGRKNEPGTAAPVANSVLEHRASVLQEPSPAPALALPEERQAPRPEPSEQGAAGQYQDAAPDANLPVPGAVRTLENDMAAESLHAPAPRAEKKPVEQAKPASPAPTPKQQAKAPAEGPKKTQPKNEPAAQPEITRTVVFVRDTGATVRLAGNGPIKYKSMTLENPNRIVLDLDGQWQIKAPGVPKNDMVGNVRIGKLPDRTRVVIDLKAKPRATRVILAKDRDSLDVRIDK